MPKQFQQARNAIQKIQDELSRLDREGTKIFYSDDFKKGKNDAGEEYRENRKKHSNLDAVLGALRGAEIVKGPTPPKTTGKATKNPPKIIVTDKESLSDIVVAQILAHEAVHLLSESHNSVEQEIRCRKKETELWKLLKDDSTGGGRHHCDFELWHMSRPPKEQKWRIFWGYYKLGMVLPMEDKVPEPPKPPKPKKKGKMRIWRSRSRSRKLLDLSNRFFHDILDLIVIGHQTENEYSFWTDWPNGYAWQESEDRGESGEAYTAISGVKLDPREQFPSTITVVEEPDCIHGGAWARFGDLVACQRDMVTAYSIASSDPRIEIIQDEECEVGEEPGHCWDIAFDTPLDESNPDEWRVRARTATYYTQRGTTLVSLSLTCRAEAWEEHSGDLARIVENLRFNT